MYRSLLNPRERAGAVVAVVAVHAAILLALLAAGQGSTPAVPGDPPPIELFEVIEQPDPPLIEQVEQEQAPEDEGAASPPNVVSQASPLVAPEPVVVVPPVSEVTASPTPAEGSEPTQGAAPVPGPGTGAGGVGTGTGSGEAGSGSSGGGSGQARGPSVIQSTTLRGRDYPRAVLRAWPSGAPVFVAVRVQLDGRATDCKVNRSSGDPTVDASTCELVERRVRFRPALDDNGRPYVAWYGYVQRPVNF